MVDRIREILSVRQLTPTQFADTVGVARPIISHILSGRNKPSLEVVQKIIAAFPDLSLIWLLNGAGAMLATNTTTSSAPVPVTSPVRQAGVKAPETARVTPGRTPAQPDRTAAVAIAPGATEPSAPISTSVEELPSSSSLFSIPRGAIHSSLSNNLLSAPGNLAASLTEADPGSSAGQTSYATDIKPLVVAAASVEQNPAAAVLSTSPTSVAQPFTDPGKAIRRIVIFYQDGTFTDYQPEAK